MAIYSDLDISLDSKQDGDINIVYEENAINNSLKNIFTTLMGSRRMLPTFGCNIHKYLFDQLDEITAYSIGEELYNALTYWDKRVVLEKINVLPDYEKQWYDIIIKYYIVSDPLNLKEFTWILKRS